MTGWPHANRGVQEGGAPLAEVWGQSPQLNGGLGGFSPTPSKTF